MTAGTSHLPFASHSVPVGGNAMHYVDEGSGSPVIMVHGNPTWTYHFRRLISEVAPRGRAIALDHIGMGWSDRPDRYDYRLERRIADFGEFVDQVASDQTVSLVVHDWGGAIGLGWAAQHVDRVDRIVALNTAAFLPPDGVRIPPVLHLARSAVGRPAVLRANAFVRGLLRWGVQRPMPPEVEAGYLAPYDTPSRRRAVYEFVRDIPVRASHPTFRTIAGIDAHLSALSGRPLLLGWGMRDFVFDGSYLAEWLRRFPDAEVARYEDAGHLVLEDAAEDLVPRIARFVT